MRRIIIRLYMNKFRNKYRIPSARLIGYDYGSHGFYFVTICTKDKICFFGQASLIGNIANEYWQQIPLHFPFIELDEFIIMPNHLHGILFFNKPDKSKGHQTSLDHNLKT